MAKQMERASFDALPGRFAQVDLTKKLDRAEYEDRLAIGQRRLLQLRLHLGGQMGTFGMGPGLLVLFEGPDAAGKGGAIKTIVGQLDPRHYSVENFAAPTWREKHHHYLWRFWRTLPGLGEMSVYDRSWYGRVLVERVEGFATPAEWGRAYESIVDFERSLVVEGTILVKFWIHLSDAEQLKRFRSRELDPLKRWKLTDEDWRNRDRNREHEAAAEDMFARTDHELAPWDVISGEQKRWARIEVLETLIARVEEGMRRAGMPVPDLSELDETQD